MEKSKTPNDKQPTPECSCVEDPYADLPPAAAWNIGRI